MHACRHTCSQRRPGPGLQRARRRQQAGVGSLAAPSAVAELAELAELAVLVAKVVGRVEALETGALGQGARQERRVLVATAIAVAEAVVAVPAAVVVEAVVVVVEAPAAVSATATSRTLAESVDMSAGVNETGMLVGRGTGSSSSVDLARARVGRRHFKQGGE